MYLSPVTGFSLDSSKRAKEDLSRKHRRGKKKKASSAEARRDRYHRRAKKRPPVHMDVSAPSNTTQFIMNDHSDTIQFLDVQLGVSRESVGVTHGCGRVVSRARESSFSLDSDEDYYYSSPEDEEDFLSKEFLKDYNRVRADRLVSMSKGELISEYLQMEARIDALEKRLQRVKQLRHR
jgi:protein HEXIM1/2